MEVARCHCSFNRERTLSSSLNFSIYYQQLSRFNALHDFYLESQLRPTVQIVVRVSAVDGNETTKCCINEHIKSLFEEFEEKEECNYGCYPQAAGLTPSNPCFFGRGQQTRWTQIFERRPSQGNSASQKAYSRAQLNSRCLHGKPFINIHWLKWCLSFWGQ